MLFEEETIIANWGQKLEHEVSMELILTLDDRSEGFRKFCSRLSRIVPAIQLKTETKDESAAPAIRVGNVQYLAIPTDRELEPFLKALSGRKHFARQLVPTVRAQLDNLHLPAPLKIYVTPQCSFCPSAVEQLLVLAAASEFIMLTIIDGALFPEMATLDNVRSAPTVLLDDQYRWTGSIQVQEVVDMILSRDPAKLSAASLEAMFKEGGAVRVAEMMTDGNKIFPAFLELLVHEKWPVRLGAMVAFETIAAKNQKLAARVVPFLWKRFAQAQDTVKGDILYLLGKSGAEEVTAKLESVLNGPFPDEVKEAAGDALEALRG